MKSCGRRKIIKGLDFFLISVDNNTMCSLFRTKSNIFDIWCTHDTKCVSVCMCVCACCFIYLLLLYYLLLFIARKSGTPS